VSPPLLQDRGGARPAIALLRRGRVGGRKSDLFRQAFQMDRSKASHSGIENRIVDHRREVWANTICGGRLVERVL